MAKMCPIRGYPVLYLECQECEDKIKEQTAASARVMVEEEHADRCVCCGKPAKHVVLFARAY